MYINVNIDHQVSIESVLRKDLKIPQGRFAIAISFLQCAGRSRHKQDSELLLTRFSPVKLRLR